MIPPILEKKNHKISIHGDTRIDPYYWLRDDSRSNDEVINYLKKENLYTEYMLRYGNLLRNQLFNEIYNRIEQEEYSIPFINHDYIYRTIYLKDKEYPIYQRKLLKKNSEWSNIFDVNERAKNVKFYSLNNFVVSEDNKYFAITEDYIGNNQNIISIKDINNELWSNRIIHGVSSDIVWSNDSKVIFYIRNHPTTYLSYQVYFHKLNMNDHDEKIYQERDLSFSITLSKTISKQYILIIINNKITSEYRLIDANNVFKENKIFFIRKVNHKYELDHLGDCFYIKSNYFSENFGLYYSKTCEESWKIFIKPKKNIFLEKFTLFNNWLVIEERTNALVKFRQINWKNKKEKIIQFNSSAYTTGIVNNYISNTKYFFCYYTSLTVPLSILKINMITGKRKLIKQQIVKGYNVSDYVTKRIWITVKDNIKIPVSLVYKKKLYLKYKNPILLYGYGAYGINIEPVFSISRLSLLDRGFVYAIIHVRGGGELGEKWYKYGKIKYKLNTFTDFIDVTKKLIIKGYCDIKKVYAIGGSAGGLLMGVIINKEPSLYHGVIAQVPFVDVLTTMLDTSIPLTTLEYEEWGNPQKKDIYFLLKSYSPYDNIKKQSYPNLLVTASLYDSQVQYWEPVKWVAKLREYNKIINNNLILLKINMHAGHLGMSGRFNKLHDIAIEYSFILMLEDKKKYFNT